MRANLLLFCLTLTAFSVLVKGKPRGTHHAVSKFSSSSKEKDMLILEEANETQVLPTLVTIEASRLDKEEEEMSSLGSINSNKDEEELEEAEQSERSVPVLLSEEELVDLLKEESKEKEREEGELESEEAVAQIRGEEDEETEETEKDKVSRAFKEMNEEEGKKEMKEVEVEDKSSVAGTNNKKEFSVSVTGGSQQELDGSTDSEIPVNVGLVGDSEMLQPLPTEFLGLKPSNVDSELLSKKEMESVIIKEEEKLVKDDEMPTITGYVEFGMQNTEALESEEVPNQEQLSEGSRDQNKSTQAKSHEQIKIEKDSEVETMPQVSKNSVELGLAQLNGKGDEDVHVEKSASITKGKSKKQKKKHRVRKHPPQRDEVRPAEGHHNQEEAAQKPKRRRAGKWAPSVGMNPVQIRATVELYPSARPFQGAGFDDPEASGDPCEYFHCKRGKTCKLNEDKKPFCVCQEPTECPQSANEHDHVCGTDNNTYDTSCELFATKCNLEGTKRGHKLQLDYTGSCKFIAQCLNTELIQFPLRMRDWLKNVLLQLYEQDSVSPGFLTPKQRLRVKKISESERRLRAGDHPIELLVQDFEKNYNMYIYPVHWQFAQMDQYPSDRLLSHSELAPLRVPLVPMEHCTSRFFQECDADNDKQVSFKEWAHCFGIKDEDMDVNLLF